MTPYPTYTAYFGVPALPISECYGLCDCCPSDVIQRLRPMPAAGDSHDRWACAACILEREIRIHHVKVIQAQADALDFGFSDGERAGLIFAAAFVASAVLGVVVFYFWG